MDNLPSAASRRYHRKRISALRLSSDSVPPLPVYSSPLQSSAWSAHSLEDLLVDKPPDYPESSEEADADESDQELQEIQQQDTYVSPFSTRRARKLPSLRSTPPRHHRQPSNDLYLDSLLARSVQALEMSNTLLQSSLSTQSSLSAVLASESTTDRSLEGQARDLSASIRRNSNVHETWMDDMDHIRKRMDSLLADRDEGVINPSTEDSVSQSLPTSGLVPLAERHHRRRPSLEVISAPGHLDYSNHERNHFISPPPKALTVYVGSDDNPNAIRLPSTLGDRSTSPRLFYSPHPESSTSGSSSDTHVSEPSCRAYDLLSSYASPSTSRFPLKLSSPLSTRSASCSPSKRRGSGDISESRSSSLSRRSSHSSTDSSLTLRRAHSRSSTLSRTESTCSLPRSMTPPIEEHSSASNSSSSDTLHAVQSLRQILDNQAERIKLAQSASSSQSHLRPPSLLTPDAVKPIASTSHATASVTRLLKKGTHSSSTRPQSPPRHSSLKSPSLPATPSPSPSTSLLSVPSFFGSNSSIGGNSGRSSPNRVSFAELPESYARSKPEGSSTQFKGKKDRKRGKGKRKAQSGKNDGDEDDDIPGWMTWLLGSGSGGRKQEERIEDRAVRWGMRPPGPGLCGGGIDEWTI